MVDRNTTEHDGTLDCLVVGGGPAGLLAATYLGRFRRRVIVIDAGENRSKMDSVDAQLSGLSGWDYWCGSASTLEAASWPQQTRKHLARSTTEAETAYGEAAAGFSSWDFMLRAWLIPIRLMASAATYRCRRSPTRPWSASTDRGTVRTVYFLGSRSALTCAHVSGIETVAPGRARGERGATAVAMRSLRR